MAAEKQKFLQGPLGCLMLGDTWKKKVEFFIAWATIEAGRRVEAAIGDPEVIKSKIGHLLKHKHAFANPENRAWALGKEVVALSWHDAPTYCVSLYREMWRSIPFVPSPYVRVMMDVVQEAYSGQFEFRDFAVLCSLYAIIGDKQYCSVHRDRVRSGALGYSKPSALFDKDGNVHADGQKLLSSRADKAEPLTTNQIRHTLNRLHNRRFFTRLQPWPNCRTVYYSRSLSHDELAERLVNRIEKRFTSAGEQGTAQNAFRQKAAALLKRLSSGASQDLQIVTADSPGDHRNTTAGVTGDVTAGVTALIDASSNRCTSNEFPPNGCTRNTAIAHRPLSGGDSEKETESGITRQDWDRLKENLTP